MSPCLLFQVLVVLQVYRRGDMYFCCILLHPTILLNGGTYLKACMSCTGVWLVKQPPLALIAWVIEDGWLCWEVDYVLKQWVKDFMGNWVAKQNDKIPLENNRKKKEKKV